jgi:hypothetical protein
LLLQVVKSSLLQVLSGDGAGERKALHVHVVVVGMAQEKI